MGAGFYIDYTSNFYEMESFHLGRHSTVFQAEVFAITQVAKKLQMEETQNKSIVILVDSQAAIFAIQSNVVKSFTVLQCIQNLNELGKQKLDFVAWTPGHTGIRGNEMADYQAKSASTIDTKVLNHI